MTHQFGGKWRSARWFRFYFSRVKAITVRIQLFWFISRNSIWQINRAKKFSGQQVEEGRKDKLPPPTDYGRALSVILSIIYLIRSICNPEWPVRKSVFVRCFLAGSRFPCHSIHNRRPWNSIKIHVLIVQTFFDDRWMYRAIPSAEYL